MKNMHPSIIPAQARTDDNNYFHKSHHDFLQNKTNVCKILLYKEKLVLNDMLSK